MKVFHTFILLFAHMCTRAVVMAFSSRIPLPLHGAPVPVHAQTSSQNAAGCKQSLKPTLPGAAPMSYNRCHTCSSVYQAALGNGETDAVSDDTNNTNESHSYFHQMLSQFHGDFDNYNQVVRDRRHGLEVGVGGGHEHIHCTLVPCPQEIMSESKTTPVHISQCQWVLAAFYFNGNPRQIFRFRAYQLIKPESNDLLPVRMKLHTLLPELEQQLRQCSEQPCTWWKEAFNVWRDNNGNKEQNDDEETNADELIQFKAEGVATMVSPLPGCDVLWDPNWDEAKHNYLYQDEYEDIISGNGSSTTTTAKESESDQQQQTQYHPSGESYHATMEAGAKGAIVDSISMIPGKRILIKDELSLWNDEFWINDRGYDPDVEPEEDNVESFSERDSGGLPFVYGNRRGIPYKLQRVSRIEEGVGNTQSVTSNSDLEWTLGDAYRTIELYERRMHDIGSEVKS